MENQTTAIREAKEKDFDLIWQIFHETVSAGETYGFPRDTTREEAHRLWMDIPLKTYVAVVNGEIAGTYYIKSNFDGPGSHICNCGYMVSSRCRGRGIARAMCEHSQQRAVEEGYLAMQFNFVASSNTVAVSLWQKLGFEIAGRLHRAFNHPSKGFIDAYVMYKWLEEEE